MLIKGEDIKIALDSGPMRSGDAIRGIGFYTEQMSKHLDVDIVDFSFEDISGFHIAHFTRFHPFFRSLPLKKPKNTKFIATVYDLIPILYPKVYKPGIKGLAKWNLNKALMRKFCDAVITISETSKKDICRFTGIDPDKVFVTYLAPRENFRKVVLIPKILLDVSKKFGLPKKFILYVGDVNYNKNIPVLLKACEEAQVKLVIVGKQAPLAEGMDHNHSELSHLKGVDWSNTIRLGFVDDSELNQLYNMAHAYIQPSLYEGFGLPVLEAFAAGCPVVCAKTQALVEVSGGTCLYSDPANIKGFSDSIKSLNTKEIRDDVIKKQLSWVKDFSWKKTAIETKKVYEKVLG